MSNAIKRAAVVERITFAYDSVTVARGTIDRRLLRVGTTVFVRRQGRRYLISSTSTPDGIRFLIACVYSARDKARARYVDLLRESIIQPSLEGRIIAATGLRIAPGGMTRKLRTTASIDVPFDKLYTSDGIAGGRRVRRVQALVDRLDLIGILNAEPVGRPLWMHYRSLVAYLLLTCFDLLGQDQDWVTFESWLSSSNQKHKLERERAVRAMRDDTAPITAALTMSQEYASIYGVGRGFKAFIANQIPVRKLRRLLRAIVIEKRVMTGLSDERKPLQGLSDKKKIDWL